jgi:HEAT repeat protein
VAKAAALALVSIGTKTALEPLASMLLHGSDVQRRFVAESLAYNQEEGFPMLKEGSEMEDLLVRRAVVYGLAQVRQSWADQILEKLAMEDKQWVVRAAATHVLELKAHFAPNIPVPLPPLNEAVWLIRFASQRGMGVAPGKPSQALLLKVLKEGEPDEKIAALDYLKYSNHPEALPEVMSIYLTTNAGLKQAAYETLWFYAASGHELPELIH